MDLLGLFLPYFFFIICMNDLKILNDTCFFFLSPTLDQISPNITRPGVVSNVVSLSPILQSQYIQNLLLKLKITPPNTCIHVQTGLKNQPPPQKEKKKKTQMSENSNKTPQENISQVFYYVVVGDKPLAPLWVVKAGNDMCPICLQR